MSTTLYYSPGTASLCVHWMLVELSLPFEAVTVDFDANDQRAPGYLRLNPMGRVPTLVIDGVAHHESAALLMLLAERHPEAGFAPAIADPARAEWLEDMITLANTLLPAYRDWFYADKDGDPEGASWVRALARSRVEAAWERIEGRLADGRSFMVGGRISTVDFLATMLMRWSRNMPKPATIWPHLSAYAHRMSKRPCFIEVSNREGLTGWPPQ